MNTSGYIEKHSCSRLFDGFCPRATESGDYYGSITVYPDGRENGGSSVYDIPVWHYEKPAEKLPEIRNLSFVRGTGKHSREFFPRFDFPGDESSIYGCGFGIEHSSEHNPELVIKNPMELPADAFGAFSVPEEYFSGFGYGEFRLTKRLPGTEDIFDINGDGVSDIMDALDLMKNLNGDLAGAEKDLNGDSEFSILDLIALMKKLSG